MCMSTFYIDWYTNTLSFMFNNSIFMYHSEMIDIIMLLMSRSLLIQELFKHVILLSVILIHKHLI